MSHVQARYFPVVVGVDSTVPLSAGASLAGFVAITTGTVTVKNASGVTIVASLPVTAGTYYPLPFFLGTGQGPQDGASIVTAGGASGTAAVW